MHHTRILLSLLALCLVGYVPVAHAAYTITFDQVGPDVVATGSGGSLDLTNLTLSSQGNSTGLVNGPAGAAIVGLGQEDTYSSISGPASFGTGAQFQSDIESGPLIGKTQTRLLVPRGYVSGTAIGISTATWTNDTISTLGITPGTYVYTWGTAPHADSFTVRILPEPASLSLLALAGVALVRRR